MKIDIDGHRETLWAYVLDGEREYDLILGRPWMDKNEVTIAPAKKSLFIHSSRTRVRSREGARPNQLPKPVSPELYQALRKRSKTDRNIELFSASMADIQKALKKKELTDPRDLLPEFLKDEFRTFMKEEADKLAPHRGSDIDHAIELIEQDGKPATVPWGPLYNMSREELLVLRQQLTSYLDKGFIRVSKSSASAPVLFVKKPSGGLRFCVDYRALNAITKKDRYPLPLIHETLSQISKATWFTKVDVIQAFHKIRIAKGDEWKTAFRTRFGLYEWLVTPFGLANAPSTFQRYINWVLREYLDEWCSAYVDDVLIYSSGTREEHEAKVKEIVQKLGAAGLHLDVGKSEFSVKSTKYLGFIIEAGKGIRMDPAKVAAIKSWEPPKTVKGIRSFLGFANFYRQFISQFSSMAEPLTRLTGKNATFKWGEPQQRAFDAMKAAFTREPALANFDPDLETVLECDASGWATGGVLSQYGKDKVLRTVAYFSAKNSKAEVNYTIHDKEMLAVIKCLQEWSTELKQVKGFTVVTDHKNLEYFCKAQLLSERHVRWSSLLSQFNLTFAYRPGKVNNRADALSRKEEDVPPSTGDERTKTRQFQLLKPFARVVKTGPEDDSANDIQVFSSGLRRADRLLPVTPPNEEPRENRHEKPEQTREETPLAGNSEPYDSIEEFETLWKNAAKNDETYQLAKSSISSGARKFPVQLNLKVSLSECSVDDRDRLCYRGRVWVPNSDALRTKIIDDAHHSPIAGHPGRGNMYAILSRAYLWPGMSTALRRYVENCDICGRTKPWRELKQGLLKPLPLPDRIWKEISMDFITDLPESEGNYNLMVVTDRLSKDIILVPLPDLSVKTVTRAFISNVVGHHWLPNAIVSDRGTQFLSDFWQTMCQLLKITRRLSTAFHPQTDGSTERMNSVVEAYLRAYINWAQDDWSAWVPMAQIAIKGRVATSTGFSPFFLQHGYDVDPVQIDPDLAAELLHRHAREPTRAAASMVQKFAETIDFVKAQMAEAQQVQERQANAHRREAPQLKVGDKVWLKLGNQFSNGRASRKLDWKNRKFTVVEVISPHNVKLDVDGKVHPVFHVDRLKLCPQDPLHGQSNDDPQPGPLVITNDDGTSSEEWKVDSICGERRSGRGGKRREYLVQWEGHVSKTWEREDVCEDLEALDRWLSATRDRRDRNGNLPPGFQLEPPEGRN
ncbi:hypothetical protein M3J09_004211 [Ascochyta lentis]